MTKITDILLSTNHLIHPTRIQHTEKVISRLDKTVACVALVVLGIISLGAAPIYYYVKAKDKLQKLQKMNPVAIVLEQILKTELNEEQFTRLELPPAVYNYNTANSPDGLPKDDEMKKKAFLDGLKFDDDDDLPWCGQLAAKSTNGTLSATPNRMNNYLFDQANRWAAARFFPEGIAKTNATRKQCFEFLRNNPQWVGRRASITVDNHPMDIYLFGKKETIHNGRWGIYSHGLSCTTGGGTLHYMKDFFENANSNFVFFDYPGMCASKVPLSRRNVIAVYQAVLHFIEDKEKGLNAKEIICWGTSLGGGVSGHSLKKHAFNKDARYVIVSEQTFSTLAGAAKSVVGSNVPKLPGLACDSVDNFIRASAWQLSSRSLAKLNHPHVIIHKATKIAPQTSDDILHDGLFGGKESLAGYLLSQRPAHQWKNKRFIGTQAFHCQSFTNAEKQAIRKAIEESFLSGC